jgi:hypothetical protein
MGRVMSAAAKSGYLKAKIFDMKGGLILQRYSTGGKRAALIIGQGWVVNEQLRLFCSYGWRKNLMNDIFPQ